MARVVLIKPFTGLHLAVSQLSAELRRAGHDTHVIYFKKYIAAPRTREAEFSTIPYAARGTFLRGEEWNWTYYQPPTERDYELLAEEIREFGADLIGISLTTGAMPFAAEVTARLRRELDLPIIWGGAGPTLEPHVALQHADYACVGEGEDVIVEVARRVDEGLPMEGIPGVWTKSPDGSVVDAGRAKLPNFEGIAIPDFDPAHHVYIDDEKRTPNYYSHWFFNQYIIMTQRGCPFSCSFCVESRYQDMFGKSGSVRRRSVDVVIDELVQARDKLGFRSIMFYDDVFTIHRKWLVEFADKYAKRVGLPFWCYTYPTTTRRDDIRLLRDAGLASMTIGLQSGSQRILDEYFNRPAPLERAIDAAQIILDEGVSLYFDLISKVPWETEDDLRATFDLLVRFPRGVKLVGVAYMIAYPTYGYTERMAAEQPKPSVSDALYEYYHRLYVIAVSDLPTATKRAIAANPLYRKRPDLLKAIMPNQIDFHYLLNDDERKVRRQEQRTLDLGYAQAVLADDPAPATNDVMAAAERASASQRRLPVLAT